MITAGSRSDYLRHEPEHAVFLAYNCTHDFPAFKWTRFRIQEADMTPLHLLQQAHSNPIFAQFTALNAGIGRRDSELEYAASLELEKTREALAEQQRLLQEKAEKLAQEEKEVKQYATRLRLTGVPAYLANPSDANQYKTGPQLSAVPAYLPSPSYGSPMQLSTPFANMMSGGFPPSPFSGAPGGPSGADYEAPRRGEKRARTDYDPNDHDRRAKRHNPSCCAFELLSLAL